MIQLTGVGPTFGQFVHFSRFAPSGNDYSLSRYRTEMRRLYDLLEARLGMVPVSAARNIRSPTLRRSRGRATTTPRA